MSDERVPADVMADRLRSPALSLGAEVVILPREQAESIADEIERLRAENERLTRNYDNTRQAADRYHEAWKVLVDLDRNEHGRHRGDVDTMDPSGSSQGNPFALDSDYRIGTTLMGKPILWATLEEIVRPRRALEGDER